MKGFVVSHKGIEDISALEIKELTISKAIEVKDQIILFDFDRFEDLFTLCYRSQSASKVCLLLDSFSSDKDLLDLIVEKAKKLSLVDWIGKKAKLSVACIREGNHLFTSQDVVSAVVRSITKNMHVEIDYKHPDVILFLFVNVNYCYVGIDFSGIDLSKHDYKIFVNQQALKGPIAYSLLRIADVSSKDTVVDPFVKSGESIIEGALFMSGTSPLFYHKDSFAFLRLPKFKDFDFNKFFEKIDKKVKDSELKLLGYDSLMRNIVAANKNSKIAGINKLVNFSRTEIDWIDLKLKKQSVDKIVTQLPMLTKRIEETVIKKIYDNFFNQAEYIMKKKGILVAACKTSGLIEGIASNYHFILKQSRVIWQGQQQIYVFVFGRSNHLP